VTPARIALVAAATLYVAVVAVALLLVPWDATVAPWADLASDRMAAFTSEQISAIEAYVAAAWIPGFLAWLAPAVLAVIVLIIPRARAILARIGPSNRPFLASILATAALLAATRVVTLPFALLSAQARRDHGLLVESATTWWVRWLGESLAVVVIGALGIGIALAILRRWPRRGWIAIVGAAMLVAVATSALLPLIQRLEGTAADPALTARVIAMADRLGVDVGTVTVIETADRSPAINAHVSGWGPTRAVTIYDTVGTAASPEQIDALVAHELVHVREGDVALGTVLAVLAAGGTAALAAALLLSGRTRRWLGASSPGDARMVPLVVAVALVASLVSSVGAVTVSRALEARTDREALTVTGDRDAYADLLVSLAVTNKSTLTPPRWRYALLFTHPTPLQRLAILDSVS
jgi:STE24 endopeptidase